FDLERFEEICRDVLEKAARRSRNRLAARDAMLAAKELEPLLGAGDADVEEASFLLYVLGLRAIGSRHGYGVRGSHLERARVRDEAFLAADEEHEVELEAFASVQRRERDDVARVFLFVGHLQRERVEKSHEVLLGGRIAAFRGYAVFAAVKDAE